MTKPWKGKIEVDIRESKPDWDPYIQPQAPDSALDKGWWRYMSFGDMPGKWFYRFLMVAVICGIITDTVTGVILMAVDIAGIPS
jgi:hypothetical protein